MYLRNVKTRKVFQTAIVRYYSARETRRRRTIVIIRFSFQRVYKARGFGHVPAGKGGNIDMRTPPPANPTVGNANVSDIRMFRRRRRQSFETVGAFTR